MKSYQKPSYCTAQFQNEDVMLKSAVSLTGISYHEEDIIEKIGGQFNKTKHVILDLGKLS